MRFRLSRVALPLAPGAALDALAVPFVTEVEDYAVEIAANGVAAKDEPVPTEAAIESVGSNPARERLTVRVGLAEPSGITVSVVTCSAARCWRSPWARS